MYYHYRWTKVGTKFVGRKFRAKLSNVPRGMVVVFEAHGTKIACIAGSRQARDLPKNLRVVVARHCGHR
jgi:hypothetical protein